MAVKLKNNLHVGLVNIFPDFDTAWRYIYNASSLIENTMIKKRNYNVTNPSLT